jgi:hypothetical protein
MPRVADFVTIQDHGSTIPDPDSGINDVHLVFDAPDVSSGSAILIFLLKVDGEVGFGASLNGRSLFQWQLEESPPRSFHEVISTPGLVEKSGNNLTFGVSGNGRVTVSDVALLFQALV